MKIVLITDNHTPTGGAENYFFALKEKLKNHPEMTVFSMGFGQREEVGSDYYVLPAAKSQLAKLFWRVALHPFVYFKLRKQLKKIRPDVIHLHNVKQHSLAVLHAIKPYPVVQTMHDFSVICPSAQNIHRDGNPCATGLRLQCFWQHQVKHNRGVYLALVYAFCALRRQLRKTVSQFIAPSPLLVEYLKKNRFEAAIYIPPFKTDKPENLSAAATPTHFLFAGNLGKHKGVYVLLEEFALACQQRPDLMLTIAGTGPEAAAMQSQARAWGIEKNLRFLGWQTNIQALYTESSAVIFPSLGLESFGLVMTEAMGHARPVIGTARGTCAWLIEHEHTGLLFDPLKKGELAKHILQLANQPEFAKTLGLNGYKKWQGMMDNEESLRQIIEVYRAASR